MHKCFKCGTEFDGKFCPTCGLKWEEEKVCPECGANLPGEARFCNQCGYSFAGKAANVLKPQSDMPQKLFSALRLVPFAALALFSVLLFAFFAAPVAEMVMGEGFPNVSLGNVYSMQSGILSELPELNGSLTSLIVFAVIAFLYACAFGAVRFVRGYEFKKIKIAKFEISLASLLDYVSFIFYLIIFIISVTVMGMISSADGGMGILVSGACPILLMVFSIVLVLLAVGSLVARLLLAKKFPELSREEKMREERYIEAEKARKEQYYATHTAPVPPVMTGKLKKVYNPVKVTKQSRLSLTVSIFLLLISITFFGVMVFTSYDFELNCVVFTPCLLFVFTLMVIARCVEVGYIKEKNLLDPFRLIVSESFVALSIIFYLIPIHYFDYAIIKQVWLNLFISLFFIAMCVYMYVKNLIAIKAIQSFQKQSSLKGNLVNDLNAQYAKYHSVVSSFCIYKHEKRRYDKAKESKTSAAVIWFDLHKISILVVTSIMLAIIILLSLIVPIFTNKFRVSLLEYIHLGDEYNYYYRRRTDVLEILGEPEEILSNDSVWVYCDDKYKDILKKIDDNDKAQEEAVASGNENKLLQLMNEEKNLYEKLDNLTYRYIEIGFEVSKDNGSRSSDDVEYVFFDAERCETKPSEKTVKKYSVLTETYSISDKKIVYRTYFTDGSYYSAYAQPVVKDKHGTYVELIWSDKFYNEYKADLKMY